MQVSDSKSDFSTMQSTFISNYMEMEEPTKHIEQRSCFQRTFGPMNKGGVRMSVLTLLAACLGVGMLGLPNLAKRQGLIVEIALLCITAIISCLSMHLLGWSANDLQSNSYTELVQVSLGNRAKRIFEVVTILQVLMGLTNLQISFQMFVYDFCINLGMDPDNKATAAVITQLLYILPNLALSFQKQLYSLRYFSLIGVSSIMYLTSMVALDCFIYPNPQGELHLVTIDSNLFTSFALTFFCFQCHLLIFPIRRDLVNPTPERQSKVWVGTTIIVLCIYLILTITGYLNFLDGVQLWIIHNYSGMLFFIGKLGMSLAIFCSVPLNIIACRNIIQDMLLSDEQEYKIKHKNLMIHAEDGKMVYEVNSVDQYKQKIHIYGTLFLQLTSGVFALFLPNVKYYYILFRKYMALIGGLGGTTIVCLFPLMIYLKEYRDQYNYKIIILEASAIICGWLGAIMSFI